MSGSGIFVQLPHLDVTAVTKLRSLLPTPKPKSDHEQKSVSKKEKHRHDVIDVIEHHINSKSSAVVFSTTGFSILVDGGFALGFQIGALLTGQ